jgi:hypothetical protein
MSGAAEIFPTRPTSPAPALPESLADWSGYAVEVAIVLNKLRRAKTPSHLDNQTAMESVRHARAWWRHSTAHQWPERGKKAEALRAGIEPGLMALRGLRARLVREGEGAVIEAPGLVDSNELRAALAALGLDHLPIRSVEAGRQAA